MSNKTPVLKGLIVLRKDTKSANRNSEIMSDANKCYD